MPLIDQLFDVARKNDAVTGIFLVLGLGALVANFFWNLMNQHRLDELERRMRE